ncbi:hypothetical protein [Teredinibacter purpureus]|uniref:hypothetical protein n=1 Tax=Teredinibacter purpureus TaxID=2731756 RepID=UPI0013C44DE1|nr:hypothetical protein [Teredinibacter purpureus]
MSLTRRQFIKNKGAVALAIPSVAGVAPLLLSAKSKAAKPPLSAGVMGHVDLRRYIQTK